MEVSASECGDLLAVFDAVGQAELTLPYAGGCAVAAAFNPYEHLGETVAWLCSLLKRNWHKCVWRGCLSSICPCFPPLVKGGWDRVFVLL